MQFAHESLGIPHFHSVVDFPKRVSNKKKTVRKNLICMVYVHFFEEADDALLQFVVFISKAYGIRKNLRRPKIFSGFFMEVQ